MFVEPTNKKMKQKKTQQQTFLFVKYIGACGWVCTAAAAAVVRNWKLSGEKERGGGFKN
jgi:hypothetical protein